MDTMKQRQHRRDNARLTESGNARSEQLNTRGAYRVANQPSLACLSGSELKGPAGPKITLWFSRLYVCIYIYICMCVRTYHVRNNYVTYIVAMRPYFFA